MARPEAQAGRRRTGERQVAPRAAAGWFRSRPRTHPGGSNVIGRVACCTAWARSPAIPLPASWRRSSSWCGSWSELSRASRTWWQVVLYSVTGSVTFVMVFVIQHAQQRQTSGTQRKLDELIRSSAPADNALIAVEEAADEHLQALTHLNLADRTRAAGRTRTDVGVALSDQRSYGAGMLPHGNLDLAMGFYFFPRGGSAQVARYLCRALPGRGGSRRCSRVRWALAPTTRTPVGSSRESRANHSTTPPPNPNGAAVATQ